MTTRGELGTTDDMDTSFADQAAGASAQAAGGSVGMVEDETTEPRRKFEVRAETSAKSSKKAGRAFASGGRSRNDSDFDSADEDNGEEDGDEFSDDSDFSLYG